MLARTFILILFLSFSYSLIDDCLRLCFDNITAQIDDVSECETDNEEEKNMTGEIEQDKISPEKQNFILFNYFFLNKKTASLNFVPSLLTAQHSINTPPPEMLLNVKEVKYFSNISNSNQ